MIDLTVSHVSGVIAAGTVAAQVFIPTATTLILAGLLSDENTLMTWTQAARAFHSSYWPFLVRADFTVAGPVSRPVTIEAIVRPLALFLLGIAGIVTPLGLYDAVVLDNATTSRPFGYQKDPSPFGEGTAPRSGLGFNRRCGSILPVACPGTDTVVVPISETESELPNGYDLRIPENVTEMFQSGLENLPTTVSSAFDIEWRTYNIRKAEPEVQPPKYVAGVYRHIEMLSLRDGYHVIEGLVVDNNDFGIGFRNHTIPPPLEYGGVWSEDLLFVEPHTECVNSNLTIDYTLPNSETTEINNMVVTDRGGFANLNQTYPYYDRSEPQKNPDLLGRAYKAAFLFNAYAMMYMNVTNPRTEYRDSFSYLKSAVGSTFPVKLSFELIAPTARASGTIWGIQTRTPPMIFEGPSNDTYPNPHNITEDDFDSRRLLCRGSGDLDLANITNIGVECNIVLGSPQRTDGPTTMIIDSPSNWSIPVYSCASATKATIKTVDFRYNGTQGLSSLSVDKVRDKTYDQDEDKPLWGVEHTMSQLRDVQPLWGLVADRYRGREDLSVLQHEHLWLPGRSGSGVPAVMNLPVVEFHMHGYLAAYGVSPIVGQAPDFSGQSNVAMFKKWQDLSGNASTMGTVLDNIWMDTVANSVVGSRGWTQQGDGNGHEKVTETPSGKSVDVHVNLYRHRVKYHVVYGIPAYIVLGVCLVVAITAAVLSIFGNARPSVVRKHIFHTAVGRIMAAFTYPGQAHPHAETIFWNRTVGGKKVTMANLVPQPTEACATPGYTAQAVYTNMEEPLLQKAPMVSPTVRPAAVLRSRAAPNDDASSDK